MRMNEATPKPKPASREAGDLSFGSGIASLSQFHRQKQAGPVSLAPFGLVAELERRRSTSQTRYRHDQQRHGRFVADGFDGAPVDDVAAEPRTMRRPRNELPLPGCGPFGDFRAPVPPGPVRRYPHPP